MSDRTPAVTDHDPALRQFLDHIISLAAERHALGPDAFLAQIEALSAEFAELRRYRKDELLAERFTEFAQKRFSLIDDPSEYAQASDEVLTLATVLGDGAKLGFGALRLTLDELSKVLAEEEVPRAFKQVLRRTRQLAKLHGDAALLHWVEGVIRALPSE